MRPLANTNNEMPFGAHPRLSVDVVRCARSVSGTGASWGTHNDPSCAFEGARFRMAVVNGLGIRHRRFADTPHGYAGRGFWTRVLTRPPGTAVRVPLSPNCSQFRGRSVLLDDRRWSR